MSHRRRGAALVEFAFVATILYLLVAAVITFGHMLFVGQGLQHTSQLTAREISQTPLPANSSLDDALQHPRVRQRIYDPHYLVLNLDTLHGYPTLRDLIDALPIANQQLTSVMLTERIDTDGDGVRDTRVLRYPGTIERDIDPTDNPAAPPPSGFLVWLDIKNSDGTRRRVSVVEELRRFNGVTSPFSVASEQRGLVALQFNYPFQSTSLKEIETTATGTSTRLFQRVLSTRAIFRREVFE